LREDYSQTYRDLYNNHWWWRARERLILDLLHTKQPPAGWGKILDVGCGDGLFFDALLQLGDVEGVEVSPAIAGKNGKHTARIHVGNFDPTLKLNTNFGLILMLDVLEHMRDPTTALRYALTLLAPNGKILITVPAFQSLWTSHDVLNEHIARYTKRTFRSVARDAGLQIESDNYFFHWLFPVKMLTRISENILGSRPRPPRLPPRRINQALYWFSLLENRALSGGRLPFGSSLLVFGSRMSAG
jgi:SAM-dependent methyltransferase